MHLVDMSNLSILFKAQFRVSRIYLIKSYRKYIIQLYTQIQINKISHKYIITVDIPKKYV